MRSSKPILLVEDDNVDVMTVKRALKDLKVTNELVCRPNGEEALDYLKDASGEKRPCIILLDLNMPKMNGIEFLEVIKADSTLKGVPVVVLTTSENEEDRSDSFRLGAAGYMIKPADYEKFVGTIRTVDLYWTLSELANGDKNTTEQKA
jgi:CheY-like chemotaxis protein